MQREQQTGRRVHLLGYSIGGKFAARIGKDLPNISSVFLLDPVDGGPPFASRLWPQFPVFLIDPWNKISCPTWLVETQYGEKPSPLGPACVNFGLGSEHFRRHIQPQLLIQHFARQAGHLDVIGPSNVPLLAPLIEVVCGRGTRQKADIEAEVLSFFRHYVNEVFSVADTR